MITDEIELEKLREASARFNKAWLASGKSLTSYTCPRCDTVIRVRRPELADVQDKGYWDSLTACIHCGNLAFLHTYPDGTVIVNHKRGPNKFAKKASR